MKLVRIIQSFKPRYEVDKQYGFNDIEADYLVLNGFGTYVIKEKVMVQETEIEVPMIISPVVKNVVRTAKKQG